MTISSLNAKAKKSIHKAAATSEQASVINAYLAKNGYSWFRGECDSHDEQLLTQAPLCERGNLGQGYYFSASLSTALTFSGTEEIDSCYQAELELQNPLYVVAKEPVLDADLYLEQFVITLIGKRKYNQLIKEMEANDALGFDKFLTQIIADLGYDSVLCAHLNNENDINTIYDVELCAINNNSIRSFKPMLNN